MRDERMIRRTFIIAVIVALLGISAARAQDASYGKEQAAKACIHNRLAELVEQDNRNVTADAVLTACANDLKAEMKEKRKTDCEVNDYIGWLIKSENSKIYGVAVHPYKADKEFLARCQNSAK